MTSTTTPASHRPGRALPLAGVAASAPSPPFRLPGEHFAAALLWLGIGVVGLVVVAPELARGNFLDPRVLATTHAFTLGVITTSIFGALYQLFPAVLGASARSVRAGHVTFWTLQLGIILLASGFWVWRGWLQGLGWLLLAVALGGLAWNLTSRRRQAPRGLMVGRYVAAGHAALGTSMLLAVARIGETIGWWHVNRLGIIASHFHLAALGFATFTAVGVGSRILPMFLSSRDFPEWPLRWIGPAGGAGMTVFLAGQLCGVAPLTWSGALLMAGAALLYLHLAHGYFRTRAQRQLDPALSHVALGHCALALAVIAGITLLAAPGFHPRGWAVYGLLAIIGWLVLFIVGVLYRILPALTWMHLFSRGKGRQELRTAADLIRPTWAWTSLACLIAGLAVVVSGVALGSPHVARGGAVLFALGVAVVHAQVIRVLAMRLSITS